MKTVVIIPVYNHEEKIGRVIEKSCLQGYPVIVVNDGSTDGTRRIIETLPNITLLHHVTNEGKGAAIITGLKEAQQKNYDMAVTIDGDGQHAPEDIPQLLKVVTGGEHCLVVGKRQGMSTNENVPWTSKFGRKFSNFWVWAAGGPFLEDSQSGMRLYPIQETLALVIRAQRYQFEVEVLVKARQNGIPIKETPVQVIYQPKGERVSHFKPWLDFWRNSVVFNRLIWARLLGLLRP